MLKFGDRNTLKWKFKSLNIRKREVKNRDRDCRSVFEEVSQWREQRDYKLSGIFNRESSVENCNSKTGIWRWHETNKYYLEFNVNNY